MVTWFLLLSLVEFVVCLLHIYMKAAIQDALQEGIIFKDPTYKVSSRGGISDKSDRDKFLNYNETKKLTNSLIDGIKPTYVSRYMILLGIATGMRYAEILGLTWNCIDFEDKTVRVEKTWDYVYKQDFSNTKNYQSMRLITVDDFTLDLLKQLKKHQREYYFGRILKNEKNLVFLNDDMELISNSAVNKTLKKHQKKIGIDQPINFHGLRHTHASILIYQGVNLKYVSRRLGHKKIETTLGIYQHILDEMEQKESQIVSTTMGVLFA
ncbi:MAG: site-specific integrase [Enterococcus casseliflavus]|nr:site-specific integrase [Enterococcus casseliflavus]